MMGIKRACLWFWMLSKRLYKKPAFLTVLALVLLLSIGYGFVDTDDSGVLNIAIAQQNEDLFGMQIMETLTENGQLMRYIRCDSPEAAKKLLETGKVDAVWIFPEDMQSKLEAFAKDPSAGNAYVTVLERESNVAARLTREALSQVLYTSTSRAFYLNFVRQNLPELEQVSDQQLLEYYDGIDCPNTLFHFTTLVGQEPEEGHYLLWPIRGLLAVVVMLCAVAAGMYYIHQRGIFAWLPERKQPLAEFGCQLAGVLQVTIVSSVALACLGMAASLGRELAIILLYSWCCSLFGMLIRRLCRTVGRIGVLMPLLIVAALLICPIFLDLNELQCLQYLLPPTYYINAVADGRYLLYMILYGLCMGMIYWLLGKLHRE